MVELEQLRVREGPAEPMGAYRAVPLRESLATTHRQCSELMGVATDTEVDPRDRLVRIVLGLQAIQLRTLETTVAIDAALSDPTHPKTNPAGGGE